MYERMINLKYYAVYKGKSGAPKIFTSWDECKKEVKMCIRDRCYIL